MYYNSIVQLMKQDANERLTDFLPLSEKLPQTAVYWFKRYLGSDTEHKRIISLYNAFGSLPGGFDAIPEIFKAAGETSLGNKFLNEVDKIRAEDDETGPAIYKCGFSAEDFKNTVRLLK